MKSFYTDLFEYSHNCNHKLVKAFLDHQDMLSEQSIKWFNHILNAHHVWNSRILGNHGQFGIWEIHTLQNLKSIEDENFAHSINILDTYKLDNIVMYTNSRGKSFQNKVGDILFHIVNHSTYHRGQIAVDFRQSGIEPIPTDFIFYKR